MSRLVNQYILDEGNALSDSSDSLPLRRQLSARGTGMLTPWLCYCCNHISDLACTNTGVAALCPPEWKSLRHEVDSILFVENVFLVLYNQLRSLLKNPASADGSTEAVLSNGTPNAQLAIPVRLVRDAIEVCRYRRICSASPPMCLLVNIPHSRPRAGSYRSICRKSLRCRATTLPS
jgi:hypothetical protein